MNLFEWVRFSHAGVVQLVRTSACHAEGRGVESRRSRHLMSGLPSGIYSCLSRLEREM
jgi:hypothetical protein